MALALRLALVAIWQLLYPEGVFPDESTYIRLSNEIAQRKVDPDEAKFWGSNWAFFRPLTFVAEVTGNSALFGRVAIAIIGSLLAVVVFLLGRAIGLRVGIIAGTIVALYPSQVLWSSMILKDTLTALLLAASCLSYLVIVRDHSIIKRATAALALLAMIFLLQGVRVFSAVTLFLALLLSLGSLVFRGQKRFLQLLFIGAVTASVVLATTIFSDQIPLRGTGGNEALRRAEYEDAKTLISCTPVPLLPGPSEEDAGWLSDISCLPHTLRMMLLDPFPHQLSKSVSLIPPFAEQILWLPLVALVWKSRRRFWRTSSALQVPSLLLVGLIIQWSLIDRVFGTAFRHRTEFFWIIALLASSTLVRMIDQRQHGNCRPV